MFKISNRLSLLVALGAFVLFTPVGCLAEPMPDNSASTLDKQEEPVPEKPPEETLHEISKGIDPAVANRHALLVGCSDYEDGLGIHDLYGPTNDVSVFYELLTSQLKFPVENVQRLAVNTDIAPTSVNIAKAFEKLVSNVKAGDQVFILLSGHGVQVPIPATQTDALDPQNPEVDGLDEVFLPVDFGGWKKGELINAIKDDQIGRWLGGISDRGGDVWIVFDCCHSGTMSRGIADAEIDRGVQAFDIGVSNEALTEAARKSSVALAKGNKLAGGEEEQAFDLPKHQAAGDIVAFYAAQSFETAPELPRPRGAPRSPEHYHGLLSYTIAQIMTKAQGGPLTYEELANSILAQYRADRGGRSPTPHFDGPLKRSVIAVDSTAKASLLMQIEEGVATLNAGQLMGVRPKTVLRCRAADDSVIGYVEVSEAATATATVAPCKFEDVAEKSLDEFPNLCRCEIVSQELGELRVKLKLQEDQQHGDKESNDLVHEAVRLAIDDNPLLLQKVDAAIDAEWVLRIAEPETAEKEYGLKISEPQLFLLQSPQLAADAAQQNSGTQHPRVFGQYGLQTSESLASSLASDFHKIFTWRNIWRVSGEINNPADSSLVMKVEMLDGDKTNSSFTSLHPGQRFRISLKNEGFDDLAVTILFLDGDYGVSQWATTSLEGGGGEIRPIIAKVTSNSVGVEGVVVLSNKLTDSRILPKYDVLVQEPLGQASREVSRGVDQPDTPFGQLMNVVANGAQMRAAVIESPGTPEILSRSWLTQRADSPQ